MEGTSEENVRQTGSVPVAADSLAPALPLNTDDWIRQLVERLSPDEIVIRRSKGNLISIFC